MSASPRFGLDAHALAYRKTGAGNYISALVRSLGRILDRDDLLVYLQGAVPEPVPFATRIVPETPLWTTLRLPLHFMRHRAPPVMLFPGHSLPLYASSRTVVTVFDLAFELFPDHFTLADRTRLKAITRHSTRRADLVIAISHSTARDLTEVYGVDPDRIRVVHLGVEPTFTAPTADVVADVRRRYGLDRPYLLTVGTLQKRKNHAMLIRALPLLLERGHDVDLVFAGGSGWLFDDTMSLISSLGVGDRVRFTGYVPDADLPGLYAGAEAFALVSLYEGFGLPVLEAMACGAPVLVSNVSSLPEVAGDAALTVDPLDLDAVAGALARLLEDSSLTASLRGAAAANVERFCWLRTARETIATMEEVA
jgi:glycosyltransferase involved in cell wall biosynthesis